MRQHNHCIYNTVYQTVYLDIQPACFNEPVHSIHCILFDKKHTKTALKHLLPNRRLCPSCIHSGRCTSKHHSQEMSGKVKAAAHQQLQATSKCAEAALSPAIPGRPVPKSARTGQSETPLIKLRTTPCLSACVPTVHIQKQPWTIAKHDVAF